MGILLNINSKNEVFELKPRRYRIYALGGFQVNLGRFSIIFKNLETEEVIYVQKAFWPVQSFTHGKRAKRIFIVDIETEGKYEITFSNQESLTIKPSNLFLRSFFEKPLETKNIEILITEKL